MTKSSDDKRRDDVLRRMLDTPYKPQKELKKELAEKRGPKAKFPAPPRDPWKGK